MKLQSPLFILGAVFAGLQIAGAATIYQIDFERSDGTAINPIVTQAGWTSMAATNAGPATNHVMSTTGLTMTAGGTLGYFAGRGTTATWGLVTGTSWDDMQDDCISARSGDGTVTLAFSGLDDLLTYTFTAWHNVSATDSASFAAGFYTITPSVTG